MAWGWPGASRPEPVSNTELGFLLDPTVEQLILALYQQVTSSAGHFFVESVLVLAIAYLLFQKSYKPKEKDALSAQEIDELCEEWQPEALVTAEALASVVKRSDRVVTAQSGSRVTVDGKQVVNFASFDFLDFLSLCSYSRLEFLKHLSDATLLLSCVGMQLRFLLILVVFYKKILVFS